MYSMINYQQEWKNYQTALANLWEYQLQSVEQIKNFFAANPMWKDIQQVGYEMTSVKIGYNNWMSFVQQFWFAPEKQYQAFEELIKICMNTDQRLLKSGQHMSYLLYQGGEKAADIISKPEPPLVILTALINNHLATLKSLEDDQEAMGNAINEFNSALKIWGYQLMTPEASADD
jgi:hypothetical protein